MLKQLKQSILALKNGNCPHMRSFIAEFQNGSWRGVELNRTAGLGPITRQKLRQLRVDEAMQKQVAETKNQFEVEEPPVAKDERSAQEIMFNKFNSFVDDAVFYVNQRFDAFFKNPLKSFSIFDYKGFGWPNSDSDENDEFHNFGVEEISIIVDHFSSIFKDEQEVFAMKQERPLLRSLIFSNKNNTSPFKLYVQILADHFQQNLYPEMKSILKIVEILVVFSVSTASVERSFSTFNLIVTILRGRLFCRAQRRS